MSEVNYKVFSLNELLAILWVGMMIGAFVGSYAMEVLK